MGRSLIRPGTKSFYMAQAILDPALATIFLLFAENANYLLNYSWRKYKSTVRNSITHRALYRGNKPYL